MKSFIRSLLFRLGLKTSTSIVAPIAAIVRDLEALVLHHGEQIKSVGGKQLALVRAGQALTAKKRVHAAAAEQAKAAAARVSALIA